MAYGDDSFGGFGSPELLQIGILALGIKTIDFASKNVGKPDFDMFEEATFTNTLGTIRTQYLWDSPVDNDLADLIDNPDSFGVAGSVQEYPLSSSLTEFTARAQATLIAGNTSVDVVASSDPFADGPLGNLLGLDVSRVEALGRHIHPSLQFGINATLVQTIEYVFPEGGPPQSELLELTDNNHLNGLRVLAESETYISWSDPLNSWGRFHPIFQRVLEDIKSTDNSDSDYPLRLKIGSWINDSIATEHDSRPVGVTRQFATDVIDDYTSGTTPKLSEVIGECLLQYNDNQRSGFATLVSCVVNPDLLKSHCDIETLPSGLTLLTQILGVTQPDLYYTMQAVTEGLVD